MGAASKGFPSAVAKFLRDYLPKVRGASDHTISSYAISFSLLFRYLHERSGLQPFEVGWECLDPKVVCDWLEWIEGRGCCAATRNCRLAAIKAFCRFLQFEDPGLVGPCSSVLAIRAKGTPSRPPTYLTQQAVGALLERAAAGGLRHVTILQLLYDSAARVSELLTLSPNRVSISPSGLRPNEVTLLGKGNRTRTVPIMPQTASLLEEYLRTYGMPFGSDGPLFEGRVKGHPLTRDGVAHILRKYADSVNEESPGLITVRVTPHVLRHSKATHMLDAGIGLETIGQMLGHADIRTTQGYAHVTPDAKRRAVGILEREVLADVTVRKTERDELLAWFEENVCPLG